MEESYYYSSFFRYQNGCLFCENVGITDVMQSLRDGDVWPITPVFIYSRSQIVANVKAYMDALQKTGRKFTLNYAMKANMNPYLLKLIKDVGCSITLVSGFELQLALKTGFEPGHLVLNGNGKQLWEIELAVKNGCLLNIDSLFNLHQTILVCRRLERQASVLLRVNPDIDPSDGVHEYNCTGLSGSKFGIMKESIQSVIEEIRLESMIQLVGIHCHLGSTITDLSVFRKSASLMLQFFRQLKSIGFDKMRYINLGGGLGINYKEHAAKTAEKFEKKQDTQIATPAQLVNAVEEILRDDDVELILEPGRSLIANTCVLVTSVLGVKQSQSKNFIVVDGSMTEVIRPALYGAYHHIDLAEPTQLETEDRRLYNIVGPVCESGDFLGKDRYIVTPHEGCALAVFDVGAYCSCMSSNYNARPRPAEVLVNANECILIRRPDTLQDILDPYEQAADTCLSLKVVPSPQ